ncbi:MAG: DUF3160 domain-containing protein [Patescibacteria group bacterium]|nr:DUF3160 domain-containing protein [Patescibacteria group bacterium]
MNDDVKKVIFIIIFLSITVGIALIFVFRENNFSFSSSKEIVVSEENPELKNEDEIENLIDSSRLIGGLPSSDERVGLSFSGQYNGVLVEYISFLDFYQKINDNFYFQGGGYSLPLNVKTEVANYYDLSRKLNIDSQIDSLNKNGFAIIDNPFSVNNFYSIYDQLYKNEIPVLITSDFLIYYYQHILKKTFKDIEENIFYNNLWEINYSLYERARIRYEDNFRRVGNVNSRILEAQRLATAYFATSLELLKPASNQINSNNDLSNSFLFTPFEADSYSFTLPEYLKVDVEKEVALIRDYRAKSKSPVLLYDRDYSSFVVPIEYQSNAKLNNFYLTTKWLSSNFPVYYQGDDCPDCYLDADDWRVSFIASAFIAKDIFDSQDLKVKWARIYKTLAFFKGLRGDLTYVHYRDALVDVFGEGYEIENVFADNNPSFDNNIYRFRNKILEYEFLDVEGGFDKNKIEDRKNMGVKMLTDFYWPNDYIFNKLSYPYVLEYQGKSIAKNNITSCDVDGEIMKARCNGFSLDLISLIDSGKLAGNSYYLENTNYRNYQEELYFLKSQIEKLPSIWHYNNYWKALNVIKEYLGNNKYSLPAFAQSSAWSGRELSTAIGSWINIQLPIDKLSVYQKYKTQSIVINEKVLIDYNYIEPNLSLINEQISNINMISDMFKLLKITEELRSVLISLEDLKNNLTKIKMIMVKELSSEVLSEEDLQFISLLSLELKLDQAGDKSLEIFGPNKKAIKYGMNSSKLLILLSESKGIKSLSVGPVFHYNEGN